MFIKPKKSYLWHRQIAGNSRKYNIHYLYLPFVILTTYIYRIFISPSYHFWQCLYACPLYLLCIFIQLYQKRDFRINAEPNCHCMSTHALLHYVILVAVIHMFSICSKEDGIYYKAGRIYSSLATMVMNNWYICSDVTFTYNTYLHESFEEFRKITSSTTRNMVIFMYAMAMNN